MWLPRPISSFAQYLLIASPTKTKIHQVLPRSHYQNSLPTCSLFTVLKTTTILLCLLLLHLSLNYYYYTASLSYNKQLFLFSLIQKHRRQKQQQQQQQLASHTHCQSVFNCFSFHINSSQLFLEENRNFRRSFYAQSAKTFDSCIWKNKRFWQILCWISIIFGLW